MPLGELYLQQDQDLRPDVYDFAKHATHKATSPALSYLLLGNNFAVHQSPSGYLYLDLDYS